MRRDPKKYIADMLDGCRFLAELTARKSIEDYRTDRAFRSAVERELQNVGEALRQLHSSAPDLAAKISDHERIIRFRHALVHGYDSVNPELVWDVIEVKLTILTVELEALLNAAE